MAPFVPVVLSLSNGAEACTLLHWKVSTTSRLARRVSRPGDWGKGDLRGTVCVFLPPSRQLLREERTK